MSKSFSRIAATYDDTRGGVDRGRRFAAALAPHLREGRVLEVGMGTGLIAAGLAELDRDVLGVDISFEMAVRARDRIGPRVTVGDGTRLPVADGSIAAVYTVWVLHLLDVPSLMREIRRVLSRGGRYLAAGPSEERAPQDEVEGVMRTMFRDLRGGRSSPDRPALAKAAAAASGFTFVAEHAGAPGQWTTSAADVIELIEQRSYSILWDLPDDRWRAVVEPTLQRLRTLPDREARLERRANDTVLVFESR